MIDPKLQAELRAKHNPDGSDLRNMQLRMLDMLKYIDKICHENNIKYWLSSGTCLGAVRHGGFIPWDDDCDIEMLEKDYKKLITVLRKMDNHEYKLQYIGNEDKYFLPFGRLRDSLSIINQPGAPLYRFNGVWIDIFPIERKPLKLLKLSARIHNFLLNPNYNHHIDNGFIQKFFKFLFFNLISPSFSFIGRLRPQKEFHHSYGSCFYKPRYYDDFKNIKYIDFENTKLPVPDNFDHYLKTLYGDYNKVPQTDSIQTHNLSEIALEDSKL